MFIHTPIPGADIRTSARRHAARLLIAFLAVFCALQIRKPAGLQNAERQKGHIRFHYTGDAASRAKRTRPLQGRSIYLVTLADDSLKRLDAVQPETLAERTLMVGGGSPPVLRAIQSRAAAQLGIPYLNGADHETTRTNTAANRGSCPAPGFLNDRHLQCAWTPLVCSKSIPSVLYTRRNDEHPVVRQMIAMLQAEYRTAADL